MLADLGRQHSRRELSDGTILDLTTYDEFDVLFTFHVLPNGATEFIDFRFFDPR
ncbi:MAG: hypothetical protein ACREMY_06975 [bacterium]